MVVNLYRVDSETPNDPYKTANTEPLQGSFQLDGIPPGEYVLEFVPQNSNVLFTLQDVGSDDAIDSDVHPTTGRVSLTVVSGQDIDNVHAGVTALPSIGPSIVFRDDNADGHFDRSEEGISGVTVVLFDEATNHQVATTTTDENGQYHFTGLQPGNYYVSVVDDDDPHAFLPVVTDGNQVSPDPSAEYDNRRPTITVGLGDNDSSPMVGMFKTVLVGNFVWNDLNGDGVQQAGEPGMEGVGAILKDSNGNVLNSTYTDADGYYYFYGMEPGGYRVQFVLPDPTYIFTVFAKGNVPIVDPTHPDQCLHYDCVTSDVDPITGTTDVKFLGSGEENYSFDAGVFIPVMVQGVTWHDLDANGVRDAGEPGLQGINVLLFDRDGDQVGSTVSNANGQWQFAEMPPGTYHVRLVPPTEDETYYLSPQDSFDSDTWESAPAFFESGTSSAGLLDAGLYLAARIGDRVWFDSTPNGIQDGDETVYDQPVTITLYDSLGYVVAETTSNTETGFYEFYPVMPGTYTIKFLLPNEDYQWTMPNASNDTSLDSDLSPTTGTATVHVTLGEMKNDVDAGVMDYGPYYPGEMHTHDFFN